jgi:hypothetical protein
MRRLIVNGFYADASFYSTNIANKGINGMSFVKSKWREVSIKTFEKSSKLS